MDQQETVRLIQFNELEKLLELYKHLNKDDPKIIVDEFIKKLWNEIYKDPNKFYIVVDIDGEAISLG